MVEVSVVMPVRDAAPTIGSQLRGLASQTYAGTWEVVVVDNGSTDRTLEVVDEHREDLPDLRVVDAALEPAVSAVRNRGIDVARGRVVLFCDGDDVVCPTWISAMTAALEEHDAVAGSVRLGLLNSPAILGWRDQGLRDGLNRWPGFLTWGIGANIGARVDALRAVGGFDEAIPFNCAEDVDLCWRLQLAGYSLGFAPEAAVEYRMRPSRRASIEQAHRYAMNEALLYRRFREAGMPRRRLGTVGKAWLRLPLDATVDPRRQGRFQAVRAIAKNVGRLRGSIRYRVLYL